MYTPQSLCAYKHGYQSLVTSDSTRKSYYSTLPCPSNDDEQIVKSEILDNIKPNIKRRATNSTSPVIPCKMQQQMKNSDTDDSNIGIPSRLCSVCGDISTGIHFGGNSCESCKAFFRRSVQCHRYQNYKCSNEECCPVNVVTRKVCQFCRYMKCTTIGMKPKWVLSDQEREEKYGSRRKRFRENRTSEEDPDIYKFLTKEEKLLIEDIAHALYQSRATYPLQIPSNLNQYLSALSSSPVAPPPPPPSTNSSTTEKPPNPSANFLIVPIQRLVLFTRMLKDFDLFSEDDKVGLLKGAAIEMMVCSSSTLFDPKTHTFTNYVSRDQRAALDDQVIPLDPLLIRLWGEDLFHRTKNFLVSMCNLHVDEVTSTLLAPIILFSPDSSNIKDVQLVKSLQIKYVTLLRKYMNWRYGIELTDKVYPKLLLQIITIRTLSLAHAGIIQKVMSTSSVNPLVQEVTIKQEMLPRQTLTQERMDSLSSASTPADTDTMDYDKTPSVDTESNIGSDEDETNRDKARLSVDDNRNYENEDSNETNPRNIWRKRQKLSSLTETEVINLEPDDSSKIKHEIIHSNSTDSDRNPNYSQIRPYDHQVPNYVRTLSDDLSRSSKTSSIRHLSPRKQILLGRRDSSHKQTYPTHSSSINDLPSYDQHSRPIPMSSSTILPPTQQGYDDKYRQHISRMPSASSQQQTEEHFHHLSLANNQSPTPPIQSTSSQQSHSSTSLNADEQQLLDAIHAHPNKRDLVLNLLRQMNESTLPSSMEHQTSYHNQQGQQRRSESSLNYNPHEKHSNTNQNNDLF